jgi:general secretion pathway protein G
MRNRVPRNAGFTLIELMVVIVILGLLVGLVGPNVMKAVDDGRISTAKAQMATMRDAVKTYRIKKGRLPDSMEEAKDEMSDGTIPKDPWGNDYRYEKTGKNTFDIVCYGGDGQEGGEDEVDQDIHLKDLTTQSAEK